MFLIKKAKVAITFYSLNFRKSIKFYSKQMQNTRANNGGEKTYMEKTATLNSLLRCTATTLNNIYVEKLFNNHNS